MDYDYLEDFFYTSDLFSVDGYIFSRKSIELIGQVLTLSNAVYFFESKEFVKFSDLIHFNLNDPKLVYKKTY